MASASRYLMSFRTAVAVLGLACLLVGGSITETAESQARPFASNPSQISSARAPLVTLEFNPADAPRLYQDIKFRRFIRGLGRVVRRIGRGAGEVLGGTIRATGEMADTVRQAAAIPGQVGSEIGTEVGGFVGGFVGGRKGRRAGKKIGRLAGNYYGGRVASRSSLIRTVNRAGAKAEHIQEIALKWDEKRNRIRAIFRGDVGELIGEIPGVIQERISNSDSGEILNRVVPNLPVGGARPPLRAPTPMPIPHPH